MSDEKPCPSATGIARQKHNAQKVSIHLTNAAYVSHLNQDMASNFKSLAP
ncbi:hypothetical protein [Pseudomonas marincola]|nr:hypothetical protein [Pseudomonas marincola]